MESPEITYHGYFVIPLTEFDERLYAAMRILRSPDGIQRAPVSCVTFLGPLRRASLQSGMQWRR